MQILSEQPIKVDMADKVADIHEITCKICNQSKKRIRNGKYGGRTPRWVGEDGKLWNGLVCGECHAKRAAVTMFNKRAMDG